MAYTAWSVVAGEQPTASKWNQLGSNDASFNDGTGIGTSAITPEKLFAGTGTSWVWQSWTPTWGNITSGSNTLGNGTLTALYSQVGKTVRFRITLTFGTTTTSTGVDWKFTPPVAPAANQYSNFQAIGTGIAGDTGVSNYIVSVRFFDANSIQPSAITANGTYAATLGLTATAPFTFGNADFLTITGEYEAA